MGFVLGTRKKILSMLTLSSESPVSWAAAGAWVTSSGPKTTESSSFSPSSIGFDRHFPHLKAIPSEPATSSRQALQYVRPHSHRPRKALPSSLSTAPVVQWAAQIGIQTPDEGPPLCFGQHRKVVGDWLRQGLGLPCLKPTAERRHLLGVLLDSHHIGSPLHSSHDVSSCARPHNHDLTIGLAVHGQKPLDHLSGLLISVDHFTINVSESGCAEALSE